MQREYFHRAISINCKNAIQYDVVIIGAGLTGLTAAFRLLQMKPDLTIKILEAKDRIGGRLYSAQLPAANNSTDVWDLGGTWIGNKSIQPFINQLLTELNMTTYPQNFTGKKLLETGKDFRITEYETAIPRIGLLSLYNSFSLLRHIDNIQKKIPKDSVYDTTQTLQFDSVTMDSYLKGKIWTQCTSDCLTAAFRAIFGTEMNKISALFAFVYFNSCGKFLDLVSSGASSSQGYKIVGGAQSICSRILEIIDPGRLELETVVTSIEELISEKRERYSVISTLSGHKYKAKHVIMAIPPNLITSIRFQPALSPIKYEYFSSVAPGHLIKIVLTYETAFWREIGFSGEIVTNGGKSHTKDCTNGPLCLVYDATTDNNSPALIGLIGGKQALEYETKNREERKESVLKSLEYFFNRVHVRNFIVYCEKIWRQEQFVGGCPMCTVPPGVAHTLDQSLRAPEHEIYFAVSELANNWIGFMEGAVECGERAAIEILGKY